jgi:primary-amine oxidase
LIKGVDCPETAIYIPGSNTDRPFSSFDRPDAMCVYEMVNGETAWRHTTGTDSQGIPRVFLVIRALYSVGNYDYNVAINLFPSGKIKLSMDAAGFMSTSTWHADEEKFGVPVQSFQSGSLHDHLFGWKLDMDIYGTKNNFAETKFAVIPTEGPNNSGGTMKAAIKEEVAEEAGFTVSTSVPNTFLVYNPNEMNSWGRPRGYALHFEGSIYNILPPDHAWSRAASWSNYNVMVTQHKEDEPYSTSEMNMYVPKSPVVDAVSFIDGESTVEEDLVLWLTVGKMHWPRSEDMPVVTNFGTSLDIRPWDYFDENALFDLPRKPLDTASCKPVIGELYDYESTVL